MKRCTAPIVENTGGGDWADSGADAGGSSAAWADPDAGATNAGGDGWADATAGGGW
jgi:hypothetical protein